MKHHLLDRLLLVFAKSLAIVHAFREYFEELADISNGLVHRLVGSCFRPRRHSSWDLTPGRAAVLRLSPRLKALLL